TPWMPKTSRLSSYFSSGLRLTTAQRQTRPATAPSTIAPPTPEKPAAGVMATRPATAPDTAPRAEAWPRVIFSPSAQASAPAAGARTVFITATAVRALASRLEPALNPNHPNQSSPRSEERRVGKEGRSRGDVDHRRRKRA